MKEWNKIIHANGNEKKSAVAIFISDKTDFKTKTAIKDKEGHCIMLKASIQQEDITFVNVYASNRGVARYIKQILMDLKREIERNIVTVGDFHTALTSMDRSSRQKKK